MRISASLFLMSLLMLPSLARAEPEIVQLSPDTYMISREDHGGIFGNASKMKTKIIKQANAFAAKQGKIAIPLASNERPMGNGPAQWASFEYQFRVVDASDPEARRTSLAKVPDMVVAVQNQPPAQTPQSPPPQVPASASASAPDVYTSIMKLDDLRKRGLITQSEYEAQKRRVLEDALRR